MNKQSKRKKTARREEPIRAPVKTNPEPFSIRNTSISCLLVIFLGVLLYANTFHVPFLFDDESSVYKSVAVRDAGYFTKASLAGILSAPRTIG
ncbi:MAG: hypothetical protein ABSE05_15670, partial [Syntrophales bacterium]